jgi:hypothetical protein
MTQIGPRPGREEELCERASHTDWLYIGAMGAGVVASVVADFSFFKKIPIGHSADQPYTATAGDSALRTIGPGLVGLFWGGLVGGTYLAMPQCSSTWVQAPPPEGEVRASWPMAVTLAALAGATAPLVVAIEEGPIRPEWPVSERWTRHLVPVATGFFGALVPYVLPPRTWAAKRELERIRFHGDVTTGSLGLGYVVTF